MTTITASDTRPAQRNAAPSEPESRDGAAEPGAGWTTTCIYVHLTAAGHDLLVHDCVVPLAEALVGRGDADGWFFLRYWHGGPHLRVRFRNPAPHALDQFESEVSAWLDRHPQERLALDEETFRGQFGVSDPHAWQEHGDLVREPYVPETDRYGGLEALAHCEEFFQVSSRVAGAVLRVGDRDKVFAVGLDLMVLALRAAMPDGLTSARSARRYFLSWDFVDEASSAGPVALQHAEALQRDIQRVWGPREEVVSESVRTDPGSTHGVWSQAVRELLVRLHAAQDAGRLTRPPEAVLWSLIHMMNNRLGISVHEERVLSWLASRICTGWWVARDYFADGTTSPDRTYLEQSKYAVPSAGVDQQPRFAAAAATPRRGGPSAAPVSLPQPGRLRRPLADVLAARESSYGDYGGTLTVEDLATILGHAVGSQRDRTMQTPVGTIVRRTYPSPGAMFATSVLVNAWDVTGVDRGLYLYYPEKHGLVRLGPALGRDSLLRAASNLASTEGVGSPGAGESGEGREAPGFVIDVDSVPAVLLLVCDLSAIRPKYGLRALRLLLQESGHMAQNIQLCATAVDGRSIPLSAFVDDDLGAAVHLDGIDGFVSTVIPLGTTRAAGDRPRPTP